MEPPPVTEAEAQPTRRAGEVRAPEVSSGWSAVGPTSAKLGEPVVAVRDTGMRLRGDWARLAQALPLQDDVLEQGSSARDARLRTLESGGPRDLEDCARTLSRSLSTRGVEVREILDLVLVLHEVLAHAIVARCSGEVATLSRVLDVQKRAATRFANALAVAFARERRLPTSSPVLPRRTERPVVRPDEAPAHAAARVLTARERQVLHLVASGKSTKEIASLLAISRKTVESHRTRLMQKLDLHEKAGLVRYAIRQGLLEP